MYTYRNVAVIRWGIYLVNFGNAYGSEQYGLRPALVVQNNLGNIHSSTTIVCPLTTSMKSPIATHVTLLPAECGLFVPSVVLCEQIRVVDKERIIKKIGYVQDQKRISEIEQKMKVSLGLVD